MAFRNAVVGLWLFVLVLAGGGGAAAQEGVVRSDSLTLEECMSIALTHNRDVKRARAELERVGGDRVIEKSRFLPHLDLLGSYDRTQSTSASPVLRDRSVSARITQRIFEFGRDPATLVNLRDDQRTAFFALENVAAATLRRVRESFFSILLRQKQIETREENLSNFRKALERQKTRFEMRESQKADVLTAELSVRQEELRINSLERGLLRERMELMHRLGRPVGSTVAFVGELEAFEFSEEESVAFALRNSTAVALAKEEVAEKRREVREEVTEYYPDLSVRAGVENKREVLALDLGRSGASDTWALDATGEHFFIRPNSRFGRFQDANNGYEDVGDDFVWFLNVDVVVPIFHGFERKGKLVKEKARLRQLSIDLDNSRSLVELSVRQAYQQFLEQQEAVRLQEETLRIAKERLEIIKKLREFGRATEDDVENFRSRQFGEQDRLFTEQDRLVQDQENLREQMRHFQ